MKNFLRFLTLVLAVFFATPARADHHAVFIHSVIVLTPTACAVELEISADGQNNFLPEDRIEIDDVELVSMGTDAATINAGGNTNDGDTILFASTSFETQAGLTADVLFPDGDCGVFDPNSVFAFVLDDPNFGGPDVEVSTLATESGFGGDNTAMTQFTAGATPQLLDLDTTTLTVSNNAGEIQVVGGSGGGGGGDSGGCKLGNNGHSTISPFALVFLAGMFFMRMRRKGSSVSIR